MVEEMEPGDDYRRVRARTLALAAPLSPEDQQVQAMPDASPTKWHLAHTSWFFEELVLDGPRFDASFGPLFNSYYEALGPRVERPRRGMLSRPPLERVRAYREHVDGRILAALAEGTLDAGARARLELGLHHEQQHQELILTDAAYMLATQPLRPAYRGDLARAPLGEIAPVRFRSFEGGVLPVGAEASGFAFDNERPRHDVLVRPFLLATRPLANADVRAFVDDGGYREPRHWLSDGWATVQREGWRAPLYWNDDGTLWELAGVRPIDPAETACHLSYYEADAIARWMGARLPTEAEWEIASRGLDPERGNFADDDRLHPTRAEGDGGSLAQMFGDVWEWTRSAYSPYPGFRPLEGALGEYNGKFMSGQQVLRGGSCLTPRGHVRASYRNFFQPAARWQMTGARVARDVD
jgi:ergothioneine biosynthesis protein EgtB